MQLIAFVIMISNNSMPRALVAINGSGRVGTALRGTDGGRSLVTDHDEHAGARQGRGFLTRLNPESSRQFFSHLGPPKHSLRLLLETSLGKTIAAVGSTRAGLLRLRFPKPKHQPWLGARSGRLGCTSLRVLQYIEYLLSIFGQIILSYISPTFGLKILEKGSFLLLATSKKIS